MSTTLDDKALFDEQGLAVQIGSWQRTSVERSIPGLDGRISIDLGGRMRTICQRGLLRGAGRVEIRSRLDAIEAFLDGDTHTLMTADGQAYANVRVDAFTPLRRKTSGAGITVEYEMIYTQLGN